MKKLKLDVEIRNPVLDVPNTMTLEYKTPPETVIVQPSNREIAEKINEIVDYLNFVEHKLGNKSNMAEFYQSINFY